MASRLAFTPSPLRDPAQREWKGWGEGGDVQTSHAGLRLLLLGLLLPLLAAAPAKLKVYEGKYYVIHTDLTGDELREADLRMTKMAEEYHARTAGFSGSISRKFPFFFYREMDDYLHAGGQKGTAGFFDPNTEKLVAMAGEETDAYSWHVVQHEGFHQFAKAVIGGELPIWVNEGMAEYFGEGLFTGDGFVTGVIPPDRLVRVQKTIKAKQFKSIKEMMLLAHADWNSEMTIRNYDQAWSMVQFLAHAENGKYQGAFVQFMRDIGKGKPWDKAWLANFGSAEGFEEKWKTYWMSLSGNPTRELYAKALVQTLTGVLARATAQQQKFKTFDELAEAVEAKTIKMDTRDWLPPALVSEAFESAKKARGNGYGFDLVTSAGAKPPTIVCTLKDGGKLTGRFTISQGRVGEVMVEMPAKRT